MDLNNFRRIRLDDTMSDQESDLGHTSFLTEVCPPKASIYDMATGKVIKPPFIMEDHCIRMTGTDDKNCYPFAVTFTFNAEHMKSRDLHIQWSIFTDMFSKWKSLFLKRMKAVFDDRRIIAYEIYPELTKQGVLHYHGLIYFNSNYQAVARVMCKAWVDRTRKDFGTSMYAMKKGGHNGHTNYAFALCTNVQSWRAYITKEHSYYKTKTILREPPECVLTMEC